MKEGLSWYVDARHKADSMARSYGTPSSVVCGVIAALSPGCDWNLNLVYADTLMEAYFIQGYRGKKLPLVGSYGRLNVQKAERIMSGEEPLSVLGGKKVRAFYQTIFDPSDNTTVVVDRHAKSAAIGEKNTQSSVVKNSEYEFLSRHYQLVAKENNLLPWQVQSIVWVVWRRTNGILNQQDLFEF